MTGATLSEMYENSLENGEARTKLQGLSFNRSVLRDIRLSCVDFVHCEFTEVVFFNCDLRGSDFSESILNGVTFKECAIYGCEFPDSNSRFLFENCIETITR